MSDHLLCHYLQKSEGAIVLFVALLKRAKEWSLFFDLSKRARKWAKKMSDRSVSIWTNAKQSFICSFAQLLIAHFQKSNCAIALQKEQMEDCSFCHSLQKSDGFFVALLKREMALLLFQKEWKSEWVIAHFLNERMPNPGLGWVIGQIFLCVCITAAKEPGRLRRQGQKAGDWLRRFV